MGHEFVVGLTGTDDAVYQQHRDATASPLEAHDAGFRFDFTVDRVLESERDRSIDRVIAIDSADRARADAFFAHPEHREFRARYLERPVAGTTMLGAHDR